LKLLECPKWVNDEDSTLPGIAQAASAFLNFMDRQNPKGYLLTHGDIRSWHKKLFEKAVPVPYYAGYYRQVDRDKPCLNGEVEVNGVFGAPVAEVEQLMHKFSEDLETMTRATDAYLASPRSSQVRIRVAAQMAAFAGGRIIQIHPFVNGNGRMARLAMDFFLHRYLGHTPFFIDRPKNPNYGAASAAAMQTGNFGPLYQYIVELLALGF